MTSLKTVKGMHDILPEEMPRWHFLERTFRELVERYGYGEIRTPILEPLELFVRGIGGTTDIVEKEMYAFEDKGGDRLALRPEGTASVIRAFVQHNIGARHQAVKVYYMGPMFRRERPAKGRFRQFFQAGAELIGEGAPAADSEVICMAVEFVQLLGIRNVRVLLNSLGDAETRPQFRDALLSFFGQYRQRLCGDCTRRLDANPLRILDCKIESCSDIAAGAPSVLDYLSDAAKAHFSELQRLLRHREVAFEIIPTMVRGLDYYTRTIFEIQGDSDALGAQAALVGGGRYDNLIAELGGRPTEAIGFSFGIERLLMVLDDALLPSPAPMVYVAGAGEGGLDRAGDLARVLRAKGITTEVGYAESSLRSQLKRADRFGAAIVLIAGDDEAARGSVALRNMRDGSQLEIPLADIVERIGALL